MGRKVHIDLGANHGNTIAAFMAENPEFVGFAFEPTPALAQHLRQKFSGPDTRVHVMECAAWIFDGTIDFFFGTDSDQSSTVLLGKRPTPGWNIDYSNRYPAPAIDFDRWLRENTSEDDHIVLKMDVEGAEYKLLARMLDTGSLTRIADLRVEWHWDRYESQVPKAEHDRIYARVQEKVKLTDWG